MRDIVAPESARFRRFTEVFAEVVEPAGYRQIIPPMMEDLGVFTRLGDATDIVTKEMYDFVDKGGRHVALRPEQTASVCRAFVELRPPTPWKTWYSGPNFRYEKPQRGRFRQFDQVGIEVLGADDPYLDVEVIALGVGVLPAARAAAGEAAASTASASPTTAPATSTPCGVTSRPPATRCPSRAARRSTRTRCACSTPSGARTRRSSPPRPTIDQFWSDDAAAHFATVRSGLGDLGIPFAVDMRLVRGLDYYRRTTFEFQGGTLDSAQNALGGGGRYDGLVEDLGGPPTPASASRSASTARCWRAATRACSPRPTIRSTCSSSTPPAGARRC